jgi:undecaprenyl-diphosphatase
VLQNLLNLDYSEENHLLFDVLLHLGTLISIIVVYGKDIKLMVAESLDFLQQRSDSDPDDPPILTPPGRAMLFVLVGTLPMILAAIFRGFVKRLFFNTGFIGFAFLITGGLLFV